MNRFAEQCIQQNNLSPILVTNPNSPIHHRSQPLPPSLQFQQQTQQSQSKQQSKTNLPKNNKKRNTYQPPGKKRNTLIISSNKHQINNTGTSNNNNGTNKNNNNSVYVTNLSNVYTNVSKKNQSNGQKSSPTIENLNGDSDKTTSNQTTANTLSNTMNVCLTNYLTKQNHTPMGSMKSYNVEILQHVGQQMTVLNHGNKQMLGDGTMSSMFNGSRSQRPEFLTPYNMSGSMTTTNGSQNSRSPYNGNGNSSDNRFGSQNQKSNYNNQSMSNRQTMHNVSPPLSIISNGSTNSRGSNSSGNYRNNGPAMHAINQFTNNFYHQNNQFYGASMPVTQQQSMPSTNFSAQNHQIKMQSSPQNYHSNNNYHSHNRNYQNNRKGYQTMSNFNRFKRNSIQSNSNAYSVNNSTMSSSSSTSSTSSSSSSLISNKLAPNKSPTKSTETTMSESSRSVSPSSSSEASKSSEHSTTSIQAPTMNSAVSSESLKSAATSENNEKTKTIDSNDLSDQISELSVDKNALPTMQDTFNAQYERIYWPVGNTFGKTASQSMLGDDLLMQSNGILSALVSSNMANYSTQNDSAPSATVTPMYLIESPFAMQNNPLQSSPSSSSSSKSFSQHNGRNQRRK